MKPVMNRCFLSVLFLALLFQSARGAELDRASDIGAVFMKQQAGIDKAKTILIEWKSGARSSYVSTNSYCYAISRF